MVVRRQWHVEHDMLICTDSYVEELIYGTYAQIDAFVTNIELDVIANPRMDRLGKTLYIVHYDDVLLRHFYLPKAFCAGNHL